MFRRIAKHIVGNKPEGMDGKVYRGMVKHVETTLRDWAMGVVLVVASIVLTLMLMCEVLSDSTGYYRPNPDPTVGELPYHWHVDGDCNICE